MRSILIFSMLMTIGLTSEMTTAAEFAGGNDFEYTSAIGNVHVTCLGSGTPASADFRCYGYSFTPAESARFNGPKTQADEVELTATREDGTTRTKTSDYDGSLGASTDTFNLWIETLFQRPLLKLGRNEIAWSIKDGGRTVQSGIFAANVNELPELSCPTRSITTSDTGACSNSGPACRQYFQWYGSECR